jgi:hypothetical protein
VDWPTCGARADETRFAAKSLQFVSKVHSTGCRKSLIDRCLIIYDYLEKYSQIAKDAANRWTGKLALSVDVILYAEACSLLRLPLKLIPFCSSISIENIFTFQSYCVDKFMVDRQEFNRNFNIPEDLDTLP